MGECVKETRLKLGDGSDGLRSVVSSQRFKFHYSSCQFSFQLNSKMLTVYRLIEMVSFELGHERGTRKKIFLYFLTELKTNHLSYSNYKHDAINIADPSSRKNASYMNFVIDLAHRRVSVAQW